MTVNDDFIFGRPVGRLHKLGTRGGVLFKISVCAALGAERRREGKQRELYTYGHVFFFERCCRRTCSICGAI